MVSKVENFLGIDVGGTSIKAGLINRTGDLLQDETIPTERFSNNETFLLGITSLLQKFNLSNVKSIGIGTPGPIDIENQIILSSANIPNIKNVKLGEHLSKITTLPIFFNNDANCASLGEYHFNELSKTDSLIVITLGTGYGCGWVYGGKIFNGFLGNGMEAGHQTVVLNGAICGCGNKGCVESYFSTRGLLGRFKEKTNLELKDAKSFFKLVEKNDEDAIEVLDFGILAFAHSIKNIVHMINPNKVVMVGGITKSKDFFYDKLLNHLKNIIFPVLYSNLKIEIGKEMSGFYGAASQGFE